MMDKAVSNVTGITKPAAQVADCNVTSTSQPTPGAWRVAPRATTVVMSANGVANARMTAQNGTPEPALVFDCKAETIDVSLSSEPLGQINLLHPLGRKVAFALMAPGVNQAIRNALRPGLSAPIEVCEGVPV